MDLLAIRPPARQRLVAGDRTARHRHSHAYAAVVLEGGYEEAGDSGRRRVQPGDVILHARFEAHANCIDRQGAVVLNLDLELELSSPFMRLADPDGIVRLAERDAGAACASLIEQLQPAPTETGDWRDALAADLRAGPDLSLGVWAERRGLARATISRGFRQAFGVSPARYRAEARARSAWRRLAEEVPLADLAADAGFADQAHMTRAIVALTGWPPNAWRRSNRFKTGRGVAA